MGEVILLSGLAFGDEGKGTMVDYLTRLHNAHTIVRFNGGAQAAHNVVLENGDHHTFSQFGSGTLAGANTYLSEHMLVNPHFLLAEAANLEGLGVKDPLSRVKIHPWARITTPFHVASNRLKEMALGSARHGSCGMGIGETVRLEVRHGISLKASHCQHGYSSLSRASLENIQKVLIEETAEIRRTLPETEAVLRERHVLENPDLDYIIDFYGSIMMGLVDDGRYAYDILKRDGTVIFEGAQGVLLDQDFGFHPHTTWSDCTFGNAYQILRGKFGGEPKRIGVLRAHMTRHGAGPFPTENKDMVVKTDHNQYGEWQEGLRFGYLDLVLAKYALEAIGGVDEIALTHLDLVDGLFRQVCTEYCTDSWGGPLPLPEGVPDGEIRLAAQEELGGRLKSLRGIGCDVYDSAKDMIAGVEKHLQTRIGYASYGPKPSDKKVL